MVISVNYNTNGMNNAFLSYYIFNCDNKNRPNSIKNVKQCLIVNGMPFEIKSIYGLESGNGGKKDNLSKSEVIKGQAEDQNNKECTICMSCESNSIIMPCGHMCCCIDCGKSL